MGAAPDLLRLRPSFLPIPNSGLTVEDCRVGVGGRRRWRWGGRTAWAANLFFFAAPCLLGPRPCLGVVDAIVLVHRGRRATLLRFHTAPCLLCIGPSCLPLVEAGLAVELSLRGRRRSGSVRQQQDDKRHKKSNHRQQPDAASDPEPVLGQTIAEGVLRCTCAIVAVEVPCFRLVGPGAFAHQGHAAVVNRRVDVGLCCWAAADARDVRAEWRASGSRGRRASRYCGRCGH
mmetsp:Transcript_107273/g.268929  ORF Transcript_107273/g.268929 Transcript_107273/m.268929 type:complete len:231 (-) Transcript_107273:220-912(-)